ncbi:hypothetical protein ABG768_018844 [Culter alburnus]|uniref:Endonuclease n=1 Tax=Culter alburnus TaxID=194366 RepID=A0AAW2AVB1_CULAL
MKFLVFLLLPHLSLSEVGQNFNQCSQFFLNNVPPQFPPPAGVSVQHICQCLQDNNNQKIYLYATLHSTTWRIPIYSAYVFGNQNVGRCDAWYIEPQLDLGTTAEPCMSPRGNGNNQAMNSDYRGSGYDRGHLYPVQHTDNPLSMLASSTLTNAAPQDPTFNQGAWNDHEKDVISDLQNCNVAYVVTGVVPDTKTINNRVFVSRFYWRATCCKKNNMFTGKGYYGPDNNGRVKPLTIANLQTQLENDYNVNNIKIFPNPLTGGCN